MTYSDKEITAFTQIAYMDHIEELAEQYRDEHNMSPDEKVLLSDLCEKMDKESRKKYNYIKNDLKCDIGKWKIVTTYDMNNKDSGFSAYVIETSPGEAVVAFRGSDGMDSYLNVKRDWVEADIKLVNSYCTKQQAEVDRFLSERKDILEKYSITMTGHSLGGNLAEYATIVSAKYGLDDNIEQCVSMDGPGFSDEFIEKYKKEIAHMREKMTHHRWSFVGTMLNDLPGVYYEFNEVSNEANMRDKKQYDSFSRHDTKYLVYDENGKMVPGEQDDLSKFTSLLSEGIDHMPRIYGDALVTIVGGIWISAAWMKEKMFDKDNDNKLTPCGQGVVALGAAFVSIMGVGAVSIPVVTVGLACITVLTIVIAAIGHELIIKVIDNICETAGKIYNWTKDKIIELKEGTIQLISKAGNMWNRIFNSGYKFASSNPQIALDTYKLRNFAQRLQRINSRISNLDRRMDSLYWQVGLFDLWNLLQADLLTGYSYRIKRCISYLNDTASDFENAERGIQNNI